MKIVYEVTLRHKTYGLNWDRFKVISRTFKEALRKARAKIKDTRVCIQSFTQICVVEDE